MEIDFFLKVLIYRQ